MRVVAEHGHEVRVRAVGDQRPHPEPLAEVRRHADQVGLRATPRQVRPQQHHLHHRHRASRHHIDAWEAHGRWRGDRRCRRGAGAGAGNRFVGPVGPRAAVEPVEAQAGEVDGEGGGAGGGVGARDDAVGPHRPPGVRAERVGERSAHPGDPAGPGRRHDGVRQAGHPGARLDQQLPPGAGEPRRPLGVADPVVHAAVVEQAALADGPGRNEDAVADDHVDLERFRGQRLDAEVVAVAPAAVAGLPAGVGLEHAAGVVGVHEHGADDRTGVGAGAGDQPSQAVGIDQRVVVADEHEVGVVGDGGLDRPVRAPSPELLPVGGDDLGGRPEGAHRVGGAVGGAVVHDHEVQVEATSVRGQHRAHPVDRHGAALVDGDRDHDAHVAARAGRLVALALVVGAVGARAPDGHGVRGRQRARTPSASWGATRMATSLTSRQLRGAVGRCSRPRS